MVGRYLEHFPEDTGILLYRDVLSEPVPNEISQRNRMEIEERVLGTISDPVQRALELGRFFHRHKEFVKASLEFRKVFDAGGSQEVVEKASGAQGEESADARRLAASYLFEIALGDRDWNRAKEITEVARREDMDDSEGSFFAARLAIAQAEASDDERSRKEGYDSALAEINKCLKQRPPRALHCLYQRPSPW